MEYNYIANKVAASMKSDQVVRLTNLIQCGGPNKQI